MSFYNSLIRKYYAHSDGAAGSLLLLQTLKKSAFTAGTRVMMHSRNNTQVWRGKVIGPVRDHGATTRRVMWDEDWSSTVPVDRLELDDRQ